MKPLQESKKILVCISNQPKLDSHIALYLIVTGLSREMNKDVQIGSVNKIPQKYMQALPIDNTKIINKLPPKKFVLEFKNQKDKVKNIQWNQEGDSVNFYISMDKGKFDGSTFNLRTMGSDYETIILIGVSNVSELGSIYNENKDVFKEANIITVGGKPAIEGSTVTPEIDEKHSSVAEDTYIFMQKYGLKIDANAASMLLAGIFDSTKNFKKNIIDPKTYITCAELIRRGGSNEQAQALIVRTQQETSNQDTRQQEGQPQAKDEIISKGSQVAKNINTEN